MFGIGFFEMLVIGGLVLVAVGPDRLPGMLKQLAKMYRQFRRTADEVRSSTGIDQLLRDEELRELAELRKQKIDLLAGTKPPAGKPAAAAHVHGKPGAPAAAAKPSPGLVKPLAPEGTMPAAAPGTPPRPAIVRGLNEPQREQESPRVGVDLAELRRVEPPPPTRSAADEEIIKAKIAAAAAAGMPVPEPRGSES